MSGAVAGQHGPIFDPTRSVVLVASAGTGKTWRLVRRYLRIIATLDPSRGTAWARPEEVVAVTFTRAAAAEMRARVFAALTGAADRVDPVDDPVLAEVVGRYAAHPGGSEADVDARARLAERLALAEHVAAAPIGTLHSLCAQLLGEFPELSGVAPDARPLEPAEQALELDAFVGGWLDQAIDELGHPAHDHCVALLHAHPIAFVRRELQVMVDAREGLDPSWHEPAVVAGLRERFVRRQWHEYLESMWGPLTLTSQACTLELQAGRASSKLVELGERITRLFLRHHPVPELDTVAADVTALMRMRPSKELGRARDFLEQLIHQHKVFSTRRERPVLPEPHAGLRSGHAEHVARWVELASLARADWAADLRARSRLRYDDLELLTRALLDDPRARTHLRGRYRHVLVDEYQDVNPIQAEIIERLVAACGPEEGRAGGGAKLFFVGDPKQSIYRFRGADPEVFERAVATRVSEVLRLEDNRRSSPTLARFFMHMFPPLFAGSLPWANVTDLGRPWELARLRDIADHARVVWDAPIVPVRAHDRMPGLAVDLLLRDRGQPTEPVFGPEPSDEAGAAPSRLDDPELLQAEADRVAAHLRGLLDRYDGRPKPQLATGDPEADPAPRLRARDCAILVPRWSLAEAYRAALEAKGIVADVAGGRGLLGLPEVRDLVNLVRLWADEHDELAALAVLRGPCLAISDLGLYVLARWPGVDRRIREADPDLPEFADLDEAWEPWDDEAPDDEAAGSPGSEGESSWPRPGPRRLREVLRHGRLDPDRAIAALRAAGRVLAHEDETLDEACARLREQLGADAAALEAGRDLLLRRGREAGARPTASLLADVITELRLEAHWLVGPRERRAVANAWRFVEHVRGLEHDGPDLPRLAAWLDAGIEPAPEGLISPDSDAVTITTWHGAKGKEWPVVVVAGIGEHREHGARDSWSGASIPTLSNHPDRRVTVPRIAAPHQGFVLDADPLREPCTNMLAPLEAAEAKRLLYVALTRARDRLVLSGEADPRTHVHYDDKPYLALDYGFDMKPLLGEPKPAYLCKRPIELLVAALDLPAARPGTAILRPRAATWSLAHVRVVDDAMLRAGLAGWATQAPVERRPLTLLFDVVAAPARPPGRGRRRKPAVASNQLSLFDAAVVASGTSTGTSTEASAGSLEIPATLAWRAGSAMQRWNPSAGRSPWPLTGLEWQLPLPARRPALLDDEDPRRLGELFHLAMERWDFDGPPPDLAALEPSVAASFREREPGERRQILAWLRSCLVLVEADAPLVAELRAARAHDALFHEVDVEALVGEADRDHAIGGRIDLLWRSDDGRWNVLDYKVTAKVRSRAQMQELEWEYGPQLLLYRRALACWSPQGRAAELGRFGLWLATAGKPMWLRFED